MAEEDTSDTEGTEDKGQETRLLVALSRTVGMAARTVAKGLSGLSAAVQAQRPSPKSRKKENLTLLLQRLGQIISEKKEGEYQDLENDKDFWQLIQRLQTTRRAHSIEKTIKETKKKAVAKPRKAHKKRMKKSSSASVTAEAEAEEKKPAQAKVQSDEVQEADAIKASEASDAEAADTQSQAAEAEDVKAEAEDVKAKAEDVKAKAEDDDEAEADGAEEDEAKADGAEHDEAEADGAEDEDKKRKKKESE